MEILKIKCRIVCGEIFFLVLFSLLVVGKRWESDSDGSEYDETRSEDIEALLSVEKRASTLRTEQKIELNEDHEPIAIYYHKEDALRSFHMDMHRDFPGREELLFAYHNVCMAKPLQPPPWYKRKPFVVVESNNMTGRDILARKLARRMRALYITNPPTCLNPVKKCFIGTTLEGAFRALGMYASAYHTRLIWNIQPVVMTGYWFDQAAYVLVMIARDASLPEDESPLFHWPKDLTCPDIMFYVHYDMPVPRRELNRKTPNAYLDLWDESYKERRKHKRLAKVYEKLSYTAKPLLFRIHTSASNTSHLVPKMEKHILDELYIKFDFKIKFYDD